MLVGDYKTHYQIVAFLKEALKRDEKVQEKVGKLMVDNPHYFTEMLTICDMHQRYGTIVPTVNIRQWSLFLFYERVV